MKRRSRSREGSFARDGWLFSFLVQFSLLIERLVEELLLHGVWDWSSELGIVW